MTKTVHAAWRKKFATQVATQTVPALLALSLGLLSLSSHADTKVRTSSFEYTAAGLLSKEVVEPNSPNDCLQTSYGFDAFGNRNQVSTSACAGASGNTLLSASVARTSANNYGADGRFPVLSSNALGQSETKAFDARFGGITSLTGPNLLNTTWAYDGFGRKTQETRADGTKTTWAYKLCTESGANCPASVGPATITWVAIEQSLAANLVASAPETRQYYDTLNRVVRVQTQGFDGAGVAAPTLVQDTEYNALGQVARQSNTYVSTGTPVWTSYTYDALGRISTQSQPDAAISGGMATTSYAYNGLSSTITNAKGQTKTTVKNAQGQVASVTDAQGSVISYSYDALGNLVQTNAAGSITTLQYNQRGHKTAMQDPAMGSWVYGYNAYGELVSQRDSLNQTTTLAYDLLGRMVKRTEPDLVSDWSYDTKFDGTSCGLSKGKLCEAKSDNNYKRTHAYDSLGRINSTATVLDNVATPAVVSVAYDSNTGRVANKTWPTGYQASYSYTALGYLKTVTGGGTNGFTATQSYQVLAMNAQGQVTQYKTGNNVTTVSSYDLQTQRLTAQTATKDGQALGNVLNQSYTYDSLGNLLTRNDTSPGVGTQESFGYDSLNRLTLASILGGAVSPPTTTQVLYDQRGNIAYKSDVGRYWYDAARPNRMTNVTLETAAGATVALTGTRALSYAFDDLKAGAQSVNAVQVGNGNLEYTVSQDTANSRHTVRFESYTSFNMPAQIVYGNFITSTSSTADRTLGFVYGPEHQRTKQSVNLTGNGTSAYFAGNTWYLNGEDSLGLTYEKEVRANGTTEHKHYLSAGGSVFALFTSRTGTLNGLPATTTSYFHKDQLGSIATITDETGVVTERLAYDPWGKRRFISSTPGQPDNLDAIVGQKTDRGYTEHEHLDEVGIIHMNGRIYDPLMGRFMSADPILQAPYNLKSFNRYSYVWNNPLVMLDPTGFEGVISAYNYNTGSNEHVPSHSPDYVKGHVYGPEGKSSSSGGNSYVPPSEGKQYAAAAAAGGLGAVVKVGMELSAGGPSKWKIREAASAADLLTNGWAVVEQVALEVTDETGKVHKVVVDSIAVKDKMVLITEGKDGLFSKLSPNQKEMFKAALGEGKISIVAAENALRLDLKAGVNLFEQSSKLNQLAVRLDAVVGGRASAQLTRIMGPEAGAVVGGVLKGIKVVGGAAVTLSTFTSDLK